MFHSPCASSEQDYTHTFVNPEESDCAPPHRSQGEGF